MISWILVFGWIECTIVLLGAIVFIITSIVEKKWRAVRFAVLLFTPLLMLFTAVLLGDFPVRMWIILGLLIIGIAAALLLTLPIGPNLRIRILDKQDQADERDAVFHRFYLLEPGMSEYEAYYRSHPKKLANDERIRAMPNLGYPGSKTYHPMTSLFQIAIFDVIERITRDVEWEPDPVESSLVQASMEDFTCRIKGFTRYLGADLVGTTKLNPAYVYSHNGRSQGKWGEPVSLNHTHAIAIGMEMCYDMIRHTPDNISMTETAYQYFEAAKVAMLVARYINRLGYEARAHVDMNYRVMCVPIAVDAGLGELGRLGLLITPEFGARLRLSVVTTNLPLTQDKPIVFGVQDFCDFCRKCATNCPSGSIESGVKGVYRGVEKWKVEQDSCYKYWRTLGSDCSVCIKVCPYSHPDTILHNLVRWAVRRNKLARRLALLGDDLFYGRCPKMQFPLPDWHART